MVYSPRGHKESDTTEQLNTQHLCLCVNPKASLTPLPAPPFRNRKFAFYVCGSIFVL